MNFSPIPAWTIDGVLPPRDATSPSSPERSPYRVQLADVVLRFATTPRRREIVEGWLEFRSALHANGVVQGFQWLDGSFAEDIEVTERRPPNDIDVVTFYRLSDGDSQAMLAARLGALTDKKLVKQLYKVDNYWVHLGMEPARLVQLSTYWYSMWSHRRTDAWKGFLQVDLAPAEDGIARMALEHFVTDGGAP